MNLILKDINKERASEIVNELDKLIDEKLILDWIIDDDEDQNYRSFNQQLGQNISIKPYYKNKSLYFSIIGEDDNYVKYSNLLQFAEILLNYFSEDIKVIKFVDL